MPHRGKRPISPPPIAIICQNMPEEPCGAGGTAARAAGRPAAGIAAPHTTSESLVRKAPLPPQLAPVGSTRGADALWHLVIVTQKFCTGCSAQVTFTAVVGPRTGERA